MLHELSVAEQRYQAVLAVIEGGLSVSEAAPKVGVSRQTLHVWLSRYADAGLAGLVDRSHRPVWCPHQMSPAVEQRLVELLSRTSRWWWTSSSRGDTLAPESSGPLTQNHGTHTVATQGLFEVRT